MRFRKLDGFRYSFIDQFIHSFRGAVVATEASSALERAAQQAWERRHRNVLR